MAFSDNELVEKCLALVKEGKCVEDIMGACYGQYSDSPQAFEELFVIKAFRSLGKEPLYFKDIKKGQ